jgi:predicted metal-dependent HD superfamily phosphohydrolase
MNQPDASGAIAYALARLEKGLSPKLTYHNLWHTQADVMPASVQIAQLVGVSEADIQLLEVAAAFHDIGFTEGYANHEVVGARITVEILPEFGFSAHAIEQIMGMIIATRLPQFPRNLLEEILADADLDILGRQDFRSRNDCLRQEWANFGREMAIRPWLEGQFAFMRNHTYFTGVARMLRDDQKKQNMAMLAERLASLD